MRGGNWGGQDVDNRLAREAAAVLRLADDRVEFLSHGG